MQIDKNLRNAANTLYKRYGRSRVCDIIAWSLRLDQGKWVWITVCGVGSGSEGYY